MSGWNINNLRHKEEDALSKKEEGMEIVKDTNKRIVLFPFHKVRT